MKWGSSALEPSNLNIKTCSCVYPTRRFFVWISQSPLNRFSQGNALVKPFCLSQLNGVKWSLRDLSFRRSWSARKKQKKTYGPSKGDVNCGYGFNKNKRLQKVVQRWRTDKVNLMLSKTLLWNGISLLINRNYSVLSDPFTKSNLYIRKTFKTLKLKWDIKYCIIMLFFFTQTHTHHANEQKKLNV